VNTESKPILLIITASYPFSIAAEATFLAPEIQRYRGYFSRIVLVPQDVRGVRSPIPDDVVVDTSLAEGLQAMRRLPLFMMGILSKGFYSELWKHPWLMKNPSALLRMALNRGRVEWMVGWFQRLQTSSQNQVPIVVFAFWLDTAFLAAGISRMRGGRAGLVARAHGGDLYAERHSPPHIPFQEEMIALADYIAPDSTAGASYLRHKYPHHASKIEAALLGTDDPGFRTAASADGVVRMVSCAFLVDVKRIDLLVRGIAVLAEKHKDLAIEWTHFGDGPLMPEISALANSCLPSQVLWHLKGHTETRDIYDWYREKPVDVFINVSSSEGTPVSIMEAISCSIPVIATCVGGNKEIVNDALGRLIPAEASAQDVAEAIEKVCLIIQDRERLKQGARAQWESRYSADKNYSAFRSLLSEDLSYQSNRTIKVR